MNEEQMLNEIFKYVGVDFKDRDDDKNRNLFSAAIGLTARDLLVVYFLIERTFGIQISEKAVISGEFNTYRNILEIIKKSKGIKNIEQRRREYAKVGETSG